MDVPLGFEQFGPVPPLQQDLGLRQPLGLGGIFAMDRRHTIGLNQYAIEQDDAENQPDAPSQPRMIGELRRERCEHMIQRAHTRTLNVILDPVLAAGRFRPDLIEQRLRLEGADIRNRVQVGILDDHPELALLVVPFPELRRRAGDRAVHKAHQAGLRRSAQDLRERPVRPRRRSSSFRASRSGSSSSCMRASSVVTLSLRW